MRRRKKKRKRNHIRSHCFDTRLCLGGERCVEEWMDGGVDGWKIAGVEEWMDGIVGGWRTMAVFVVVGVGLAPRVVVEGVLWVVHVFHFILSLLFFFVWDRSFKSYLEDE